MCDLFVTTRHYKVKVLINTSIIRTANLCIFIAFICAVKISVACITHIDAVQAITAYEQFRFIHALLVNIITHASISIDQCPVGITWTLRRIVSHLAYIGATAILVTRATWTWNITYCRRKDKSKKSHNSVKEIYLARFCFSDKFECWYKQERHFFYESNFK